MELCFGVCGQQPGRRYRRQLRKCVAPSGDGVFSLEGASAWLPKVGTHTTSNWRPKTETESGDFLQEVVHCAAAAAALAESAERKRGCLVRENPAVSASTRDEGVARAKGHFQSRGN